MMELLKAKCQQVLEFQETIFCIKFSSLDGDNLRYALGSWNALR